MYFIFNLWCILSNRTLTNGPAHYTKSAAPLTLMEHILFSEFLKSWTKDQVLFRKFKKFKKF